MRPKNSRYELPYLFRLSAVLCLLTLAWPSEKATAYEFLREFVSSSWDTIRINTVDDSDLIAIPTWLDTSDPAEQSTPKIIEWALCTGLAGDTDVLTLTQIQQSMKPDPPDLDTAHKNIIGVIKGAVGQWNSAATNKKLSFDPGPANLDDPAQLANYKVADCACVLNADFGAFCSAPAGSTKDLYFIFNDMQWRAQGTGTDYESYIALTNLHYTLSGEHLKIDSALITLNPRVANADSSPANDWYFSLVGNAAGDLDMQGILTHELGHVLGIAHSRINDDNSGTGGALTQSTMYPYVADFSRDDSTIDIKTLELDDQVAFRILYAPDDLQNTGTLSGKVQSLTGPSYPYVRGASVSLFNKTSKITVLNVFAGVTGTFKDTDGTYTLQGIPLGNTDYAIFVEPIVSDPDPRTTASTYHNVLSFCDQAQEVLSNFQLEATQDTLFPDVRKNRTIGTFDLNGVMSYNFTSDSPTRSNINFFISETSAPPNDDEGLSISSNLPTNGSALLRTGRPPECQIAISNPAGLWMLDPQSLTVTLMPPTQKTANDISADFALMDAEATSAPYLVPVSRLRANGTYKITVSVQSAYPGVYDGTDFSGEFTIRDGQGDHYSNGGGCSISPLREVAVSLFLLLVLPMASLGYRRLRQPVKNSRRY